VLQVLLGAGGARATRRELCTSYCYLVGNGGAEAFEKGSQGRADNTNNTNTPIHQYTNSLSQAAGHALSIMALS